MVSGRVKDIRGNKTENAWAKNQILSVNGMENSWSY